MIDCPLPVIVSMVEVSQVSPELTRDRVVITGLNGVFVATLACHSGPRASAWRKEKIQDRLTDESKGPTNVKAVP
jgi:hypothetical protein